MPSSLNVATANAHPLNQHALRLLGGWQLRPVPDQLHLVTLVRGAKFATEAQLQGLERLLSLPPAKIVAYFANRSGFEPAFLAEDRSLEGAKMILAELE